MSPLSGALHGQQISRRTFLKQALGAGLLVAAAGSLASISGCGPKPGVDLTVTSSLDLGHTHNVTIPGADLDSRPSEKVYTSDGPTHTHQVTLRKADFDAIANGQSVTLTSASAGTPLHTHTFTFQKA